MSREALAGRKRSALLGLAVGDALGAPLEGKSVRLRGFDRLLEGPLTAMTGGGPDAVAPGQVTDDTQMACCLASSLAARRGWDRDDAARRYAEWLPHGTGVGGQTRRVLEMVRGGMDAHEAALRYWIAGGRRPAGNGSLMRTAPIGVFFSDREERMRAAIEDSMITHADPRCILACVAFNTVLACGIRHDWEHDWGSPMNGMATTLAAEDVRAAGEVVKEGRPQDGKSVDLAAEAVVSDIMAAFEADPGLVGGGMDMHASAGFVRVALRLAMWEWRHAPSFRAAMVDVVNRGGDTDTNAAIAGALYAGFHGHGPDGAIPKEWSEAVMGALEGRPGPLRDLYHPRVLLTLVDADEPPAATS